jgi:hypothetical protein
MYLNNVQYNIPVHTGLDYPIGYNLGSLKLGALKKFTSSYVNVAKIYHK